MGSDLRVPLSPGGTLQGYLRKGGGSDPAPLAMSRLMVTSAAQTWVAVGKQGVLVLEPVLCGVLFGGLMYLLELWAVLTDHGMQELVCSNLRKADSLRNLLGSASRTSSLTH